MVAEVVEAGVAAGVAAVAVAAGVAAAGSEGEGEGEGAAAEGEVAAEGAERDVVEAEMCGAVVVEGVAARGGEDAVAAEARRRLAVAEVEVAVVEVAVEASFTVARRPLAAVGAAAARLGWCAQNFVDAGAGAGANRNMFGDRSPLLAWDSTS